MSKDGEAILDFSNAKTKRMVIDHIKRLEGFHSFSLKKCRKGKTLPQLAYLFGVVYKRVQAGIEEAWGERKSIEWIHVYCKKMFMVEPVINRNTGEVVGETVGSVADHDTKTMGEYIDQIIKWAGEYLNVEVEPPAKPQQGEAA